MTIATATHQALPSLAELIDRLSGFTGPPDAFLRLLLEGQCRIGSASAAALLRVADEAVELVRVYPDDADAVPGHALWMAAARQLTPRVHTQAITLITPLREPDTVYEEQPQHYLVMIPLLGGKGQRDATPRGAAAFLLHCPDLRYVNECSRRLELSMSLLQLYEMRLTLQQRKTELHRLGKSLESLDALSEHESLTAACMALCNHVAGVWGAERVSIGFVDGRYVRVRAISHTEKFSRKMRLVQALEMAMEECADQDLEVMHPVGEQAVMVSRAAAELARRYGATAVVSLPLRRRGRVIGVMTVEFGAEQTLLREDLESLRLVCEVSTPRLDDLHEHGRWIGARFMTHLTRTGEAIVGPRHTALKLLVVLLGLFLAATTLLRGTQRIEAPFFLQAPQRRVVPAPFDGYLQRVEADPGDSVREGESILASLDSTELRLKSAAARAEVARYEKQAALAMRDNKTVEVQVAHAQAQQAQAELDLLEDQLKRATILAPVTGVVLTGDWRQKIGAPVRTGDLLFEVAPLEGLRADLRVPEDRVALLRIGQRGTIAAASHPGQYLPVEVERIAPVAEVIGGRNVFTVRVRLLDGRSWMRPGMEGLAKIDVGRRPYVLLWTQSLVDWVRMRLWI